MKTITSNQRKAKLKAPDTRLKIGMISLGCPKTLVDSEHVLGKLSGANYQLVSSLNGCDVALLNTCAFIGDAQKESIDQIFQLIKLKKEKKITGIIVMGCLVQRFPEELRADLKEVDAFIGSGEYEKIPEIVQSVTTGKKVFSIGEPGYLASAGEARVSLTPKHYRYLKISEGCDHICTFCTIPSFRGLHRSRSISDIVAEAENLTAQGAREILITGQDTTYFGRDFSGEFLLPELIRSMDRVKNIGWFRLLYAYPSCLTTEMMMAMRDAEHMCHYLDMPLQHASDAMLSSMKRGITKRRTYDLIQNFRKIVPDLAIRTTFIVGFPGETEQDFEELLSFINDIQFERVGIFKYSQEQGTPAASMQNQVPEKVKQERFDRAMRLQQEVSYRNHQQHVGKTLQVLIEKKHDSQEKCWMGRSYMDAPEIDGNVLIMTSKNMTPGEFVPVQITSADAYDLLGKI